MLLQAKGNRIGQNQRVIPSYFENACGGTERTERTGQADFNGHSLGDAVFQLEECLGVDRNNICAFKSASSRGSAQQAFLLVDTCANLLQNEFNAFAESVD